MNYVAAICVISFSFLTTCAGERIKFPGYQTIRFVPETEEQLAMLKSLETSNPGVVILRHPGNLNSPVDIMFAPHSVDAQRVLVQSMPSEVLLEDVESTLMEHEESRQRIETEGVETSEFLKYMDHDEVTAFIQEMADANPNLVQLRTYGESFEKRPLTAVLISKNDGVTRPMIFIDGGMHAREWITVMTCCKAIQQLLDSSSQMSKMLDVYDFCIAPLVNPDGYVYSWTTNRMWRKTRNINSNQLCPGTDPNRNWSFGWGGSGTSSDQCSDIYHGESAYSCPEILALRNFIRSLRPLSYISMHSYSQMILLCDGCHEKRATTPYDQFTEHLRIAQIGVDAIRASGTQYTTGNSDDILYSACGTSADSVRTEGFSDLCYTMELRDTGRFGFLLPADQIEPCATETLVALRAMYLEVAKTILQLEDVDF